MKDARFVVHVAGDPHEGLQACRRCATVLVEDADPIFVMGDPMTRFYPAGADVTLGPGFGAIGADSRGAPCR
jgi:hypothetical protein